MLLDLDTLHVKRYCETKYIQFGDKLVNSCKLVPNFCLEKCTKLISPIENIRYYECWKECGLKYK